MRQIAAQAGVSVVAVSCALRGELGVSEATRTRIQGIAEAMGYRPDPLLSHLMYHLRSKRRPKGRHNIAFLHWPRDTYRELVRSGACQQAEQHGYHMDVIQMGDDAPSPRVLNRMLLARGIAGLIFGPSPAKDFNGMLDWPNFAAVMTSDSVLGPNLHRVVPNQYSAIQMALDALASRGYKRPGLITSPWMEENVSPIHSMVFTWQATQKRSHPLVCHYNPENHPRSHLLDWYNANQPDSLVLCNSLDYEALFFRAIGRKAAEKLGIVALGFDCHHGPITVDYRPSTLGAIAVDQLISLLHRGERGIPAVQQTLLVGSELLTSSAA